MPSLKIRMQNHCRARRGGKGDEGVGRWGSPFARESHTSSKLDNDNARRLPRPCRPLAGHGLPHAAQLRAFVREAECAAALGRRRW